MWRPFSLSFLFEEKENKSKRRKAKEMGSKGG